MTETNKKFVEYRENELAVNLSGIVGGVSLSDRDIGDEIDIEDITDTYQRFAGAGPSIDRGSFSAFIKGFTNDLDMKRLLEMIKCEVWKKLYGYAVILKRGSNITALHPQTYQQGFIITAVDDLGQATRIQMQFKTDETTTKESTPHTYFKYGEDPNNPEDGFFWFRSFRGLMGLRGLSALLPLVDPLRVQNKLWLEYMKTGEFNTHNHPVVKIKDLNDTTYNRVKADLRAPAKDRAVIIDIEDDFYYDGPLAGGSAWDPSQMLEYGDKIISRETGLLLSMLTGDPMGYLSASNTTTAQWFDAVKQYQAIILADYQPLLVALGLPEDTRFNDPYEPTQAEKYETLGMWREATEGLIDPQQIVDGMNKILGRTDDEALTLDSNYEKNKQMEMGMNDRPEQGDSEAED